MDALRMPHNRYHFTACSKKSSRVTVCTRYRHGWKFVAYKFIIHGPNVSVSPNRDNDDDTWLDIAHQVENIMEHDYLQAVRGGDVTRAHQLKMAGYDFCACCGLDPALIEDWDWKPAPRPKNRRNAPTAGEPTHAV